MIGAAHEHAAGTVAVNIALGKGVCILHTTSSSWSLLKHFAMEGNDTNMLILVAFVFMSILAVMVLLVVGRIEALYFITKMTRVYTNCQPTGQPIVDSHNCPQFPQFYDSHNCPPGAREWNKRENSLNLTACTQTQRSPQENDERFCQTVGILKTKEQLIAR